MRLMRGVLASAMLLAPAGCGPGRHVGTWTADACIRGGVAYAGGGAAGNRVNVSWFCANGDRVYVIVVGNRDEEVRIVPGGCPECPSLASSGP